MSIEADLRRWSRDVLEVASKHLNGLPPCPYARQAWSEERVLVVESKSIFADALRRCVSFDDTGKDLVVVASHDIPDIDVFRDFVDALNDAFPRIHCMLFHPGYDATDAALEFLTDNDWVSDIEAPYCMIFIQDLRAVVSASEKLERLGYYEAYPADEYETLVVARKRRLTDAHDAR